mmetsp:Transcript_24774/g.44870  ORF Transcript_24774/g.44870 Transcript_24774/m.44870 type:complete len:295 (-) Transcript_24774:224-1108(-)|eukprot:CAMPEP_0198299910 /NCGR_PEP_ID=MMETSP1449-20131203/46217_1 /TAXON_ID=420275 /ORGANISM="Attheya septentrionalis, Strain CCMP2084" /LENGTH=294 /DNA_ID=CAMNT_0044001573 /DNA_START=91 /DNA_END=975 /DNA_ORIENTATION=-
MTGTEYTPHPSSGLSEDTLSFSTCSSYTDIPASTAADPPAPAPAPKAKVNVNPVVVEEPPKRRRSLRVMGGNRSRPVVEDVHSDDDDDKEKTDEFHYDDDEIKKDAANIMVTFCVHLSLAFFAALFCGAIFASVVVVSAYGFVTFAAACTLVGGLGISGFYVTRLVLNDAKLKPMRRKVKRWQAIATAVIVQEVRDFQADMNAHFLLTNGPDPTESSSPPPYDRGHPGEREGPDEDLQPSLKPKKKRGRSIVFTAVVKPFLKTKHFVTRKAYRKEPKSGEGVAYIPPTIDIEIV